MARDFPGTTSDFLSHSGNPVSGYTFTMAAWFQPDTLADAGDSGNIFSLYEAADTTNSTVQMFVGLGGDAKLWGSATFAGGADSYNVSTPTMTAGNWYLGVHSMAGATSRWLYLGANGSVTSTNDITPSIAYDSGLDSIIVGKWGQNAFPFNGKIAELAIWTGAGNDGWLNTAEVTMLAKGYSALFVKRQFLVGYWPLMGRASPEPDLIGGRNLTVNGTLNAFPHPRILRPKRPQLFVPVAAAPGGFEPQYAARSNVLLQSGVAA